MSNRLFRRILVAVDGSPASLHALKETCRLARAEHGSITVLSVMPPYDGELRLVGVRNISALMQAPVEKALAEAQRVAEAEGISIRTVAEQGEPYEEIVTFAEDGGYDVIVLGVKGHNVSENVLMGSVTARVIGHANTNVLVIPGESSLTWERILVPVDGSEWSTAAADKAFQLVRSYGSQLDVVSVADVPPHLYGVSVAAANEMILEARRRLEQITHEAESRDIEANYVLREGEPAKILIELVHNHASDLIIMGSHGRTGLKRLLMGSVTERVIHNSPCPVLVVRSTLSLAEAVESAYA
ncbi:MAG: universal stress protein [Pseudomonadota bacterium]